MLEVTKKRRDLISRLVNDNVNNEEVLEFVNIILNMNPVTFISTKNVTDINNLISVPKDSTYHVLSFLGKLQSDIGNTEISDVLMINSYIKTYLNTCYNVNVGTKNLFFTSTEKKNITSETNVIIILLLYINLNYNSKLKLRKG